MKYSIKNNVIQLDTNSEVGVLSCDLNSFYHVSSIAFDPFSKSILVNGVLLSHVPKTTPKGKWPYRLYRADGNKFNLMYPEFCGDPMPFGNEGLIALDIGGGVAVIDSMGSVFAKARFGVYKHVNSQISSNPSGSKVSIVQWKGDNKKLMVLDLTTKELRYYPISIFDYTWLDDERLFISTLSGIKILNSVTGKSEICFKNSKSIFEAALRSPNSRFDIGNDYEWGHVEIDLIKIFNERIFLLWNRMMPGNIPLRQKHHGILSMNLDYSDPKIEFFSTGEEIISEFQVDEDGLIDACVDIGSTDRRREYKILNSESANLNSDWRILPSYRNPVFWVFHLVDLNFETRRN